MGETTIKDVARRAGVSVGTVSRYLNGGTIRTNNAERIGAAIAELGYRPNALGRSLVTGRTMSVGVLVPDAGNVFAATVLAGLQSAFQELGYTALYVDYRHSRELLREKVDFLLSRRVDGLVALLSEMPSSAYAPLRGMEGVAGGGRAAGAGERAAGGGHAAGAGGLGVPLVALDNPLDAPGVDSVVVNNRAAAARLVGALLDAGHRRVGVLGLPGDTYVGTERYLGWVDAYTARGLQPDPRDASVGPATKARGYEATRALLDAGDITAVFPCNYYLALGALRALGERGLAAGVDLGFASFDDFDFGDVLFPPLTVAQQPTDRIVRTVVALLARRMGVADVPDVRATGAVRVRSGAIGDLYQLDASVRLTASVNGGLAGA